MNTRRRAGYGVIRNAMAGGRQQGVVARRAVGAVLGGLLVITWMLGISPGPGSAVPQPGSDVAGSQSIAGSWIVQAYFLQGEYAGTTANNLMTFSDGGGLVEINPTNYSAANQGSWNTSSNGTFTFNKIDFTYDPATYGVCEAVRVQVTFKITRYDSSGLAVAFASIATTATINGYDPQTGMQLWTSGPISDISKVTAQRITAQTQLPASFKAEPAGPLPRLCG
jgi:hypothetical protein